jgi:hypothetical protein
MRCSHKFISVTNRLKGFNEINRLMYSTEAAVSGDCCSVLKLSFNILDIALLLIEAMIDLGKLSVDLLELLLHLCKPSIHLLLHLCKPSIQLLLRAQGRGGVASG